MVFSSLAASCRCRAKNPLIPAVQFSGTTSLGGDLIDQKIARGLREFLEGIGIHQTITFLRARIFLSVQERVFLLDRFGDLWASFLGSRSSSLLILQFGIAQQYSPSLFHHATKGWMYDFSLAQRSFTAS